MTRRMLFVAVVAATCIGLSGWLAGETPKRESALRFSEQLVADGYGYAFGVAAADLDADGDLDLTSADTTNNVLYWHANDGRGNFRRHVVQKDEPGWFERHAIGDLSGDGKPDIAVVKNLDGHLVWFANSGRPAEAAWKRYVITTDCKRAYDLALVDVDGDSDLDAAASAWVGNHFAWFENPGKDGWDKPWRRRVIDENIAETRTIRSGDFNGDGKPDLLGTARVGNLVAWYENAGPAGPWKRHVIDDRSASPTHGHAADVDGDGDLDVVMALGMLQSPGAKDTNQIVWYENVGRPGRGAEWKKHVVGELVGAFEAVAADLDGDRDLDVAATAWGAEGRVVWLENSGDPKGRWQPHVVKEKWINANQVIAADLDGDSRLDLAGTAERGANELRWWRSASVGK